MKKGSLAVGIIAALVLFGGAIAVGRVFVRRMLDVRPAASAAPPRQTNTIRGFVHVRLPPDEKETVRSPEAERERLGRPCSGGDVSKEFADIDPGTVVTVKNRAGRIVSTAELEQGEWKPGECSLPFTARHVPETSSYRFGVSHRRDQRFSHKNLKDKNFQADLSFGG